MEVFPSSHGCILTFFKGDAPEAAGVIGTITIPEVAHDTEEDEYVVRSLLSTPNEVSSVREAYGTDIFIQFDIDTSSLDASKQPVKDLVRTDIVPQLRKALAKLAPALVAEHGKDIQHAPGSGPPTGYTTPTTKTTSSSAAQTLAKTSSKLAHDSGAGASNGPKVNAVPVNTSSEFRTSAAELFTTFTDPQRIAAFTRSPPTVFEGAKPGGKFSLFGGGVSGEYVSLSEPKQIVQKWRLANWPQGHYSTLTIDFDQNDVDAVTVMRVKWDGVPVGEEEVTEGKWGEYYVRSLKTTFGCVDVALDSRLEANGVPGLAQYYEYCWNEDQEVCSSRQLDSTSISTGRYSYQHTASQAY